MSRNYIYANIPSCTFPALETPYIIFLALKEASEERMMADEQMTVIWDTLLEGPNMDFGYKNKNFSAGEEILHLPSIAL